VPNKEIINEGLRPFDLADLVYPLFEVDTYRSKMGEDRDVCVLSFKVKERNPARDLMEFIEKGYGFVLDADVSSGENAQGEYFVFVELKRSPKLAEEIKEITYGVKRLTGIDDWEFKYHKTHTSKPVTKESLSETIPQTPDRYELYLRQVKTEGLKNFFNKTLMDDLSLENDIITIYKPYGKTFRFKIIKEDEKEKILETTQTAAMLDHVAMGEIFWLTKVFGDYNINKTEGGFVFENGDKAILLQRIEQ
jgi:hypothetical protein